ncbi:glycosyltransferase family 4 protein [Fibrobacterota bacterium]
MNLSLSYSGGTYRGLQLASEFDRRGLLADFYTPFYSKKYPRLNRFLGRIEEQQVVNTAKVRTNIPFCILRKVLWYTRNLRRAKSHDRFLTSEIIDKWVTKKIEESSDIFLVESHIALRSMARAKALGALTFLDRQAANIEFQAAIIAEEYEKLGLELRQDPRDIEKGIREYREADAILVPSNFVKDTFEGKSVGLDKIFVITPGIELSGYQARDTRRESNVFRVVYCGGIYLEKGIHYLLEAINKTRNKNIELWLIGIPMANIQPFLKKYAGCYELKGYMLNNRLKELYSECDMFVFPTLQDSFGKVVVEAMACGLPVVVTENAGVKDLVKDGENGFIIPIRDSEALLEKIMYLYDHRNRCREMGQRALEMVNRSSGLESYADRMLTLFESKLGQGTLNKPG